MSQSPQIPQSQPNIVLPQDQFEGHWANFAALQRTPHEYTLDFVRIGPQGQIGQVVSRINFSPLLLAELRDIFDSAWEQYTRDSGVPQEDDEP